MLRRNTLPEISPDFTIRIEGVSVYTEGDTILNNVAAEIRSDEFAAIKGPSGSGKTTLLNVIGGFGFDNRAPCEGVVLYNDVDIYDFSEDKRTAIRSKHMSYVAQKPQFIENITARDNIMLPQRFRNQKIDQSNIDAAAEVLDMQNRLDTQAGVLSGGERQRAAILRAIAMNTPMMLMDEPTAALHIDLKQEVDEQLVALNKTLGKGILLVTHEATSAERIINLENGQIINTTRDEE